MGEILARVRVFPLAAGPTEATEQSCLVWQPQFLPPTDARTVGPQYVAA